MIIKNLNCENNLIWKRRLKKKRTTIIEKTQIYGLFYICMEIWIRLQKFSSDLHVQKNCSQTSFTNISYSQSIFHKYLCEKWFDSFLVSAGPLAYSIFKNFCQNETLAGGTDKRLKM